MFEISEQKKMLSETKATYRKMAHDLASPLSVLNILSEHSNDFNEEKKLMLLAATHRIRSISADILLRGSMSARESRDCITSEGLIAGLSDLIREKNFEFSSFEGVCEIRFRSHLVTNSSIRADSEELLRIFSNLLNNGREAMGNQPDAKIDIELTESYQGIQIRIQDNGPGFPKKVLDHLFTSPISISSRDGHGIGLFSAYQMISMWDGDMEIRNKNGAQISILLKYASQLGVISLGSNTQEGRSR
jgi:signal transduction histidine kinase